MTDKYRLLAKEISCPKTKGDLSRIADSDMKIFDRTLSKALRRAINKWVANNLDLYKPRYIGEENINKIFREQKVPCLKNVLIIADKVDTRLVVETYPYKRSFAVAGRRYAFDAKFDHAKFAAFLLKLAEKRDERGDTDEMKVERELIRSKLNNPRFPLYWTTLIRYAGACGYQLNFSLIDRTPPDGCLEPAIEKNLANEEHEALIRRLNYPV
jgi:hypothetical protein